MKRLDIKNQDIFLLARIIKEKLPDQKIYLNQKGKIFEVKLTKKIDYIILKELENYIKKFFPEINIRFTYQIAKN